jgi:uncharacterized protein (TIGR00106 family)
VSVIVDFAIFPLDKGESVSPYVAKAVNLIHKSGLPYKLGPMGTSIEGEWDRVMNVVKDCFEEMKKDSDRVYMTIKLDYRKGGAGRLEGKIHSLQEKLS